jgi:hypothetical protein
MPETTQESRSALALSFREKISALHEQSAGIDQQIRSALEKKITLTNATAQLVFAAKKDLSPNEFSLATDFLSSDAIASYITLGRKYRHAAPGDPDDIATSLKSVRNAMMLTGGIQRPDGHGQQQLHELNFHSRAVASVQSLASEFTKSVRRKHLGQWRRDEIDGLLAAFTPILRICKSLNEEIARRRQ